MANPKEQQFFFSKGRIDVDRFTGETFLVTETDSSITKELVSAVLTPFREEILCSLWIIVQFA